MWSYIWNSLIFFYVVKYTFYFYKCFIQMKQDTAFSVGYQVLY